MNENNKPEEVRETLERVMREKGFLNNPVTMKTDIGDFTWYVDNDSPFAKKKEYNVQPEQTMVNRKDPNCYIEFDGKNVDLYKYGQYEVIDYKTVNYKIV